MNKMGRAAAVALLLAALLAATPAHAAMGRAECVSLQSQILDRAVPYCVLLPPSYDTDKSRLYPVLYLLHGLGDDEQMLIHSGGMNLVEDLREQHQIGEFLIVTPAGGASFYINSHDGHRRYEDFFVEEFMPAVEKRYRARPGRGSRGVAGISMGGYGALHIAFRHPQLFSAVGAHSAALLDKLPNISAQDSRQIGRLRVLGSAFGSPFDAAFWNRNDPLMIARTANLGGLKIYFDCGSEDDYGFDTGALALDKLLTSRHIPHQFHLYRGGHNWTYFAEHLPALLAFESRAFAPEPSARSSLK
ncbi:MAG TPA: alpha/beta hydrolase-fold protein [Candidatus Methylomirabilis sp.]|nr:alpha/beta hydrolase-fold protein [Candidatus Methylomirabilis sp.]